MVINKKRNPFAVFKYSLSCGGQIGWTKWLGNFLYWINQRMFNSSLWIASSQKLLQTRYYGVKELRIL